MTDNKDSAKNSEPTRAAWISPERTSKESAQPKNSIQKDIEKQHEAWI